MASEVEICNRALQKIGAKRITSLVQDAVNARACNVAYGPLRDAELRGHPWRFAIERASLAADASTPAWGKANAFQLPTDFLHLVEPYPEDLLNSLDWEIEGQKIYTDDSAPLYIRYVKRVTDPNVMDPMFREVLSCRIALELCEELTQSNTKLEALRQGYKDALAEARRLNAFDSISKKFPESEWITARI